MEIWILEWYAWYEGGSVLEVFTDESRAREKLASQTRNKRMWRQETVENQAPVEKWNHQLGHQSIALHKFTIPSPLPPE